jgi:outer membrane phospholipase A
MEKEDPSNLIPKVEETMEDYFQSPSFLKSFKKVTISTSEEQEEANREFCQSLTSVQRLEYLQYLNRMFIPEYSNPIPKRFTGKIYFH